MFDREAYRTSQAAVVMLKEAVLRLLESDTGGLRNVDVGTALGIYGGYRGKAGNEVQQGDLSRIILERLKDEGLVTQDGDGKTWKLVRRPSPSESAGDDELG